jgi:choline-sulfatase
MPAEDAFEHVRNVRPGMPNVLPESHPDAYNRPIEGQADTWDPADKSRGGFWEGGTHWSEVVADDAEIFLQHAAESEQPFFMYLAFNAPHDPKQVAQEYLDLYPPESITLPANFLPAYPHARQIGAQHRLRDEFLAPMPRTEYAIRKHRQEYYALTTHMDTQIGRILDAVEATGVAENTYIVFVSDHGLAVGRHGFMGKQNSYEHSVRTPFIIVGPGFEAGRRIDARVYLQDVAPTIMDLAGVEIPEQFEFKSLLPLVRGEVAEVYPAIYGAYTNTQRMVIEDDWKLIVYPRVPTVRLYDLAEDPLEMNDRASDAAQAPRIRRLLASLQALQAEMGDPLDLSGFSIN